MERRKDRVEKEKDKSKKKEEPTQPPGWNEPLDLPKWKGYGVEVYTRTAIGFNAGKTYHLKWKGSLATVLEKEESKS